MDAGAVWAKMQFTDLPNNTALSNLIAHLTAHLIDPAQQSGHSVISMHGVDALNRSLQFYSGRSHIKRALAISSG